MLVCLTIISQKKNESTQFSKFVKIVHFNKKKKNCNDNKKKKIQLKPFVIV